MLHTCAYRIHKCMHTHMHTNKQIVHVLLYFTLRYIATFSCIPTIQYHTMTLIYICICIICTVCVCVCPPLDKGFRPTDPPFTFSTCNSHAGASNWSTDHLFHPWVICRGQRDLQSWPLPTKLHTGRSGKRTCAVTLLHFSALCFDAMVVDHDTLP